MSQVMQMVQSKKKVMQMVFIVQENSTGHVIPCRLVLAQPPHLSAVRET